MSFTERLILWLHIGVAIFTIGPATAAIMSTPRYIKKREAVIVAFLHRITRIYAIGSVLVFVFGLVIASQGGDIAKPWISISMTLFVVAAVLLFLIDRAQGNATDGLRRIAAAAAAVPNLPAVVDDKDGKKKDHHFGHKDRGSKPVDEKAGAELEGEDGDTKVAATATIPAPPADQATAAQATAAQATAAPTAPAADTTEDERLVAVERGRIVSLGGITSLIWLVILILMVWK